MFPLFVIIKSCGVGKSIFATQLTMIQNTATFNTGLLVILMIIPFLQCLVTRWAIHSFELFRSSVLSLDSLVFLSDMGVQSLLPLG